MSELRIKVAKAICEEPYPNGIIDESRYNEYKRQAQAAMSVIADWLEKDCRDGCIIKPCSMNKLVKQLREEKA